MQPRYPGVLIRQPVEHDADDEAVPGREAVVGRRGLISAMVKADGLNKAGKVSTFNARSKTAARPFTFGNAWRRLNTASSRPTAWSQNLSSSRQHHLRSGLPD